MLASSRIASGRGFTLVELLVVIGIIALLVSILLPVLGKATKQARSVQCLSNLRQVATFAQFYTQEWKGILPHRGDEDGSLLVNEYDLSRTSWQEKILLQYGLDDNEINDLDSPVGFMTCPEFVHFGGNRRPGDLSDYGINSALGGDPRDAFDDTPRQKLLLSERFWFADGGLFFAGSSGWFVTNSIQARPRNSSLMFSPPWMWNRFHENAGTRAQFSGDQEIGHPQNTANFVFGDGHAENMAFQTIQNYRDGGDRNQRLFNFTGNKRNKPN